MRQPSRGAVCAAWICVFVACDASREASRVRERARSDAPATEPAAGPSGNVSTTFAQGAALTPPALARAWAGPTARFDRAQGSPVFTIDGRRAPGSYVSVNAQAVQDESDWQQLLRQIDLARAHGIVVVDLMLANRSRTFLATLAQRLGDRDVFLFLRFDLWIAELAALPTPVATALDGRTAPATRYSHALDDAGVWRKIPFYSTLDETWLAAQLGSLTRLLDTLEEVGLARRVIGFRPMFLEGGEWFQPPLAVQGDVLVSADAVTAKPWTQPEQFYLPDQSVAEQSLFARWLAGRGLPAFAMPTTYELATPRFGSNFTSRDASPVEQRTYAYRRFQAERIAWLQAELARAVKSLTQGRALFMGIYGYLVSLAHYNGAYHGALGQLLSSPDIDALSGPYNYTSFARGVGTAFISHTVADTMALHGKVWVHEDDSRPYWHVDGFGATTNAGEDFQLLARNLATAKVHGNGHYLFDLNDRGWFASAAHADESERIWALVQNLNTHFSVDREQLVVPEIAVFVDDESMHLQPAFGLAGASTYAFSNEHLLEMIDAVARLGAPVRYYLQSDVEQCAFGDVRFALFLNAWKVTTSQRAAIERCLYGAGRTVYFQYASGLYDEQLVPSAARMSALLGLEVQVELGAMAGASTIAGERFGKGVPLSPSFFASSGTGFYDENPSRASVVERDFGSHRIVYAAHPIARLAPLRRWAERAGVHFYTDAGTVVDGVGSRLMVHGRGGQTLRFATDVEVDELNPSGLEVRTTAGRALALDHAGIKTRLFVLRCVGAAPPSTGPQDPGPLPPNPGPSPQTVDPLPRGLFREGYAGFVGTNNTSYCTLASGEHLRACGYSQGDYDAAPQVAVDGRAGLATEGACRCGPTGLFKVQYPSWVGGVISRDGKSYCAVPDGQTLTACGYSTNDYIAAPLHALASLFMDYSGACVCP